MNQKQEGSRLIYRHRLPTRLWHWVNAVAVIVMLMSGAMIFNAHPRLYWGAYGANFDPAWLQIGTDGTHGFLQIGRHRFDTTGLLGLWTGKDGMQQALAFPSWATIPSYYDLAMARRWHLFFALVLAFGLLAFLITSLINRHIARDLSLRGDDVRPRNIWHDVVDHLKLRFENADRPGAYNILQKYSYIAVVFVLLPIMILTGLTMSPGMDTAWPWLLDLFGGRQSARSIHFIAASLILLFLIVHVLLVLLAGPVNEMRSMITGWLRVPEPEQEPAE